MAPCLLPALATGHEVAGVLSGHPRKDLMRGCTLLFKHRFATLATTCASLALGTLASPHTTLGQRLPVGDPEEAYLRVLQVSGLTYIGGSFLLRPLGADAAFRNLTDTTDHPWSSRFGAWDPPSGKANVRLVTHDPSLRAVYNSGFPENDNIGALTPGRGFTFAFKSGATLRAGPLTVTARPLVAFAQNVEFPLATVEVPGQPKYAYPWRLMDLPQRFGPDPFWTLDPGQSEVRLDLRGVSASFGTTNLWWGPGVRNGIIVSNNAAGFPHASLATHHPVDLGIGSLEAQWIWGRLQQSDWFDDSYDDPGRFVTGATVTFSPRGLGLDGLSLGVARMFYALVPDDGVGVGEYFLIFQTPEKQALVTPDNPTGDDERDQLFSAFARWVLPGSGFEAYLEWARNDHGADVRDLFLQAEHAQAYSLGFQKATLLDGDRILSFRGELTHLERPTSQLLRDTPTFYAHHLVRQGYTQKGQVVGAFVGPGGDAQFVGADLYAPWGRASIYLQRWVHDQDALIDRAVGNSDWGHWRTDVSGTAGGSLMVFLGQLDVEGRMSLTRNFNRHFVHRSDKHNFRADVSVRWRVGWRDPT